ncbi:MAG: hypothetical protein ACTSRW_10675 [Candidatus Helarchaeota archaeon]
MNVKYYPIIAIIGFLISGFVVGFLVVGPGLVTNPNPIFYGYAGSTPLDPIQTLILGLLPTPVIVMIILAIRKLKRED